MSRKRFMLLATTLALFASSLVIPSPTKASGNSCQPYIWPSQGTLTSGFGNRSGGFHYGIDIAKSGTVPVRAAYAGIVSEAYKSSSYGNVVMIEHRGGTAETVYAHLASFSVKEGDVVSPSQQIGYMGNTGDSSGQHLHFETHSGLWNSSKSNAVNPIPLLPDSTTSDICWDGLMMNKGQIGRLTILKPIKLWKREADGSLTYARGLNPAEVYRVYGYDDKHGGQYSVGGGYYVTNMAGYIKYETPSQWRKDALKEYYGE